MSFSDHKITQFTHRITDLPDQPNLPADELKARFDSSPEELRVTHNAVCDDAARLEARVDGIIAETFGDTIDKSMLSTELAAELDAKAVESSVASRFSAEQTAREDADGALASRLDTVEAQKCELYLGTYTGQSATVQEIQQNVSMDDITTWQTITLGFQPSMVLIFSSEEASIYNYPNVGRYFGFNSVCLTGIARYKDAVAAQMLENGFRVCSTKTMYDYQQALWNEEGKTYLYIAIK